MSVWAPDCFRLFLSHVSTQTETVEALKTALNSYNISCFVAHTDIEPTTAWQDEIEEALRTMDALAALLTQDFHASKWTDQEVGFAMGRGVLVLSLRYGQDPYGFIGKFQGYPIAEKTYKAIAQDLVSILIKNNTTCLRMAQSLVCRLEQSGSWESAKQTMNLIEECPQMESDFLLRMQKAIEDNSQVRDSWGVPDRINSFVAKFKKDGTVNKA